MSTFAKAWASIVAAFISWVWLLSAFGLFMPRHWTWRWWAFPAVITYAVALAVVLGAAVIVVITKLEDK